MDPKDLVLVNLRVVSKLQPGDRLQCTDSRYFGIDRGYFSFLWRWFKADGRILALERLDDIMRQANGMRQQVVVGKLLKDAEGGIVHLIETYHTDPTTVSRLESILATCKGEDQLAL